MRKSFHAFDLIVLGYIAAITAVVLACRPERMWVYLGYHALTVILIALVIHAYRRHGGRFWRLLRHWYPLPLVLAAFREIHFLMPEISSFWNGSNDRMLAVVDSRLFGDVDAFCLLIAWPPFVDLLYLCYWSYYVLAVAPAVVLHAKGEFGRLRECLTVLLVAMFISYLGYFALPAVGPHHFLPVRPPELDGWILGGTLHRALMAAEGDMPDAFPSGHALVSLASLFMAWRHHRPPFLAMLIPTAGCVAATVMLRYHYVVDVLASVALLPLAVWAGIRLHTWLEKPG